jgi:hypothetical protein
MRSAQVSGAASFLRTQFFSSGLCQAIDEGEAITE